MRLLEEVDLNYVKVILAIFVLGLVFLLGKVSTESTSFKNQNAQLVDAVHFMDSRFSETHALMSAFKAYQENKDSADELLKRFILMNYQSDIRIKDLLGNDYGPDNNIYMTNSYIEEFILEYPLKECAHTSTDRNLQCNLQNLNRQ